MTLDKMLNERLKSVLDDLTTESNGDTGVYLGEGIVQVMHGSLPWVLRKIKHVVQIVDQGVCVTAISSPDGNGLCLINFDKTR